MFKRRAFHSALREDGRYYIFFHCFIPRVPLKGLNIKVYKKQVSTILFSKWNNIIVPIFSFWSEKWVIFILLTHNWPLVTTEIAVIWEYINNWYYHHISCVKNIYVQIFSFLSSLVKKWVIFNHFGPYLTPGVPKIPLDLVKKLGIRNVLKEVSH